jgi:hypothetical protein
MKAGRRKSHAPRRTESPASGVPGGAIGVDSSGNGTKPQEHARENGTVRRSVRQQWFFERQTVDARYLVVLIISVAALLISVLDGVMIAGGFTIPVPGLRSTAAPPVSADHATFNFETGLDGWAARGAASNVQLTAAPVYAGRQALAFHVAKISTTTKGFVYISQPPLPAHPRQIIAHLYLPIGSSPLLATIYFLDAKWQWTNGVFPVLQPGRWTTLRLTIPQQTRLPIRELGIMVVGSRGAPDYTGPLFLDSVSVQGS